MTAKPYPGPPKAGKNTETGMPTGVNLTPADVALVVSVDETKAARLLAVCRARVEREAPQAPEAVANEAVYLFAGYLKESGSGALRSKSIGGESGFTRDYITNHGPAFRNCGAQSLLSPWKVRRAGAIG